MDFFLGLFSPYAHGKPWVGPRSHRFPSGSPAAGPFHLHVQNLPKCYRMHVSRLAPGTMKLHLWTFHHTCTHMLWPHGGCRGIPALRRSFSSETLIRGPRGSTLLDISRRGLNNGLFCLFRFVQSIGTWKTMGGPKIPQVSVWFTRSETIPPTHAEPS
jgi:hypothetical protein